MKAIGRFSGFPSRGVLSGRGARRLIRGYFLVSLVLVFGGLITSGLLEIYFLYFESREQISQLQREIADSTAFKIDQFIQEIEKTMRGATKSREIVLKGISPEYKFELQKLLLIAPPVTEAVAIDEAGVARTHVSRLRTILPGDRRDIFSTAAFLQAIQGKSYFGPVHFVEGSEPNMTIAVPIERFAGEVIGVLQTEVNLKYIWDTISAIQVGKAGYAYAVTRHGDLIAHPDLSLVLQRRNLAHLGQVKEAFSRSDPIANGLRGMIAENLQGEKIFSSHALVPGLDWAVIIEQPVAEAYQKLYASLFRTIGLLLLGLGMAFLASLFMVRRVIRPLETLRRGAELIGSGNLEHRLEIKTGGELEVLAEEFNKMTAALQEAYAGLEQKVEERTRELVEANQKLEEARKDLEEWNQTLEEKVQKQVNELERAGRIKRFLSPQVAESVLNSDSVDLFQTHRREVTVVFTDLRGFTNFSDGHEPEEVMQFLRNYHAEIGNLIFKYEGTLEHFAGDGIMVFFNDPLPREDHTELAARMAIEVQARIDELLPEWRGKGYELDVGIGIAAGFATLGTIGFEGRMDYGAIGNVTIMASRLSSEARGGQILTNRKTLTKIENLVEAEPLGEMLLKGFARPVSTFNISKLK
jgi:class 3 adenylate cyclase/HAMP domain-containing protein